MGPVGMNARRRKPAPKAAPKPVGMYKVAASGMSFEDVRVHYNSPRPAQLGVYAHTRGSQVYIGPGQERYLEHELGHVIQQKQGIVRADGYINGVPVNRDRRLEQAADLGAEQPVQGFWMGLGGVVQMAPPGSGQTGAGAAGSESEATPGSSLPQRYELSAKTLQDHIVSRHAHDSGFGGKSHFDQGIDIEGSIQSTWDDRYTSSVAVTSNTGNRSGYILTKDFGRNIGTDAQGRAVNRLKMVINSQGGVITAFPVK